MKDFKHNNVMELVGVLFHEGKPQIMLPFMDNGDLLTFIRNPENVSIFGHIFMDFFTPQDFLLGKSVQSMLV